MTDRNASFLIVAFGIVCLILGAVIDPDRLAAAGIMDKSLNSDIPLVKATALLEIRLAAKTLLFMGVLALVTGLLWSRIVVSAPYARFMAWDLSPPRSYTDNLTRFGNPASVSMAVLIVLTAAYLVVADRFLAITTLDWINREDGLIESAQAILLLLASLLSARIALNLRDIPARRAMHFFLALLFFLMLGEEISWGQRILGLETPDALKETNVQGEINLHNMFGYFFDHLFILLFFLWGCAVPLLNHISGFFRQVFRMIGLPVPSAGLAVAMLITTLWQGQIVFRLTDEMAGLRLAELRELLSAAAFFLLMLESWRTLVIRPAR